MQKPGWIDFLLHLKKMEILENHGNILIAAVL